MDWNFKSGVIIIGSLLWQDYLEIEGDNIRLHWRNSHLEINNKIPVKLPIRYGRKSSSNIISMVFSNRMQNKKGFGYVVPFKNKINNLDELLCETVALSTAEGLKGKFVAKWGVLTYMFNDLIINEKKKEIVKFFKKRKNSDFDITEYKTGRERSCITKSLKLDIGWIEPIVSKNKNELDRFHFLLAIATKPVNPIPSLKEIAESIKADNKRKYFLNNLINGIITYDDFEISKFL